MTATGSQRPRPDLQAVEQITDRHGTRLPRPVLKGLFTPETARDYVARHHGPCKASAFRIADLVWEPRYAMWVAPSDIQAETAEPEAGL
jgi:hypothetical protein